MFSVMTAHAQAPAKAATCTACHGIDGQSANDLWPNLTDQKLAYMRKQLQAFRSGARVDPLMSPVARTLSDQDIEELAAYYARIKKAQ